MVDIRARFKNLGRTCVLVIEGAPGGVAHVVTAVIERQGRGLDALYRLAGPSDAEREELLATLAPEGPWTYCGADEAARRLAEAVVMTRIARRPVPAWIAADPLIGGVEGRAGAVTDAYRCGGCDAALPPGEQIARAHAGGRGAFATRCPACDATATAPDGAMAAVAHAWIALQAGDPRRALVHAARAEAQRAPLTDLDPVRGAALLALSNPVEATAHLRRAVQAAPDDAHTRALLVTALARAGYHASATTELERLQLARPGLARHVGSLRRHLDAPEGLADAHGARHLDGALASLAAAC